VQLVLDVGANEGLFASGLRASGYDGRIVSFEPLAEAYAKLEAASRHDPQWDAMHVALGSVAGQATLNVSSNWASSSFLPITDRLRETEPRTAYVGTANVAMTTLDQTRPRIMSAHDRVYLKLDVQGFELEVLRGATETLSQVEIVEAELSLVELYEGAPLFGDVVRDLDGLGFGLRAVDPGWVHPRSGAILQLDGLFTRA